MKKLLITTVILLAFNYSFAQVAINTDGSTANSSAALDVKSTNTGLLVPRMTSIQRNAIPVPAIGLLVFDLTTNSFWFYDGSTWVGVGTSAIQGTSITSFSDTDQDTKIQVERTADEDIINFTTAGILRWKMDGTTLASANSGGSLFIGNSAGENDDLTSNYNVFIGDFAGTSNTSGNSNLAIGYQSLYNNTTGNTNLAIGNQSLNNNTTGSINSTTGHQSLHDNTTGNQNSAFGENSLRKNTTGSNNSALGGHSLYNNTVGSNNIAIGFYADVNSNNLTNAIAIGYQAKVASSNSMVLGGTGTNAVKVGIGTTTPLNTLHVIGSVRIANGSQGANKVLTSDANGVASWVLPVVGATQDFTLLTDADTDTKIQVERIADEDIINFTTAGILRWKMNGPTLTNANTGGSVFIGNTAGANDDLTNNYNVFLGNWTGRNNTTGAGNVASGSQSFYQNISGNDNLALGEGSLFNNRTGSNNTALGKRSLYTNRFGSNNTTIGSFADVTNNNLTNATAIGYQAKVASSNTIRLGNSAVTAIGGYANWTNVSDGRFKVNVQENVSGLAFIMKLRPVTYNLDLDAIAKFNNTPEESRSPENEKLKEAELQSGFIAQEVEAAATEAGYDFHGVDKPKNSTSHYGLRYAEFVVPMVKAMQEQQELIKTQQEEAKEQQDKIDAQNKIILEMMKRLEALEAGNSQSK